MPDINWNRATWDGSYDWSTLGDEWSAPWGNSAALWYATILPRVAAKLPGAEILEIAPGHGRCTAHLLPYAKRYVGIDLSAQCVAYCTSRFAGTGARFFVNDGRSLDAAGSEQFDLVFSFDSLVHVDADAIASYVSQIVSLLKPDGIAWLHHSNLAAYPGREWQHRSMTVSADIVSSLVEASGGRVLIQERFGGGAELTYDCFTTFSRKDAFPKQPRVDLTNTSLVPREGGAARESFVHYLALAEQAITK